MLLLILIMLSMSKLEPKLARVRVWLVLPLPIKVIFSLIHFIAFHFSLFISRFSFRFHLFSFVFIRFHSFSLRFDFVFTSFWFRFFFIFIRSNISILDLLLQPGLVWIFPNTTNDVEHRFHADDTLLPYVISSNYNGDASLSCKMVVLEEIHCVVGPAFADNCWNNW